MLDIVSTQQKHQNEGKVFILRLLLHHPDALYLIINVTIIQILTYIICKFQVFALLTLIPLVAGMPSHPAPAYGHPAPAYGHPAPAYGHHAGYGYEQPKHNCSVVDVVESADICTPTIAKSCAPVELPIKVIVSVEQCYDVTSTVCTETIQNIPNEVCTYSYEAKSVETTGKTVEVVFNKVMVINYAISLLDVKQSIICLLHLYIFRCKQHNIFIS